MTPHEGPRTSLPDVPGSFRIRLFAPANCPDLLEGQFRRGRQLLGMDSGREGFADRVPQVRVRIIELEFLPLLVGGSVTDLVEAFIHRFSPSEEISPGHT